MYRSEEVRKLAPEMDPLRLGMGWKRSDLDKPKIMIESTMGDSHPGSAHLLEFVEQAAKGVHDAGGKAARYYATDICDGHGPGPRRHQLFPGQPGHDRQHGGDSRECHSL